MKIINSTIDLNRNNDYLDTLKKMSVDDLCVHMKLHYDNDNRNRIIAAVKQYAQDYHTETTITIIIEKHELEAVLKVLNLRIDELNGHYTLQLYSENDNKYPSIQLRIMTNNYIEASLYVYGEIQRSSPKILIQASTINELADQLANKVFTIKFLSLLSEELKKKVVIQYEV